MKNAILGMLIGGLLVALGMGVAQAQNPALTPYQVTVTAKCVGNMNVSLANQATYCSGIDGAFVSMNGAAPVQFAPAAAAASVALTLNGVTKDAPGFLHGRSGRADSQRAEYFRKLICAHFISPSNNGTVRSRMVLGSGTPTGSTALQFTNSTCSVEFCMNAMPSQNSA